MPKEDHQLEPSLFPAKQAIYAACLQPLLCNNTKSGGRATTATPLIRHSSQLFHNSIVFNNYAGSLFKYLRSKTKIPNNYQQLFKIFNWHSFVASVKIGGSCTSTYSKHNDLLADIEPVAFISLKGQWHENNMTIDIGSFRHNHWTLNQNYCTFFNPRPCVQSFLQSDFFAP